MQRLAHRGGFSELIRQSRLRAGLTQQELADLSALSVRALRDLEAGRVRRPRRDTVRLLAAALRLNADDENAFLAAAACYDSAADNPGRPEGADPAYHALVGRDAELQTLQELLIAGDQRLISVVGLPQVGKSRLALEVANRFVALGWRIGRTPEAVTGQRRAGQVKLLLLDDDPAAGNSPAELVRELMRGDPLLRLIRCSTTPLGLNSEHVLPLGGLRLPAAGWPAAGEQVSGEPAVQLFVSHARRGRRELSLAPGELAMIAELCRLLDGMPAAIENAADWSLVLSWQQLLQAAREDPIAISEPPSQPARCGLRTALAESMRVLQPEQYRLLRQLNSPRQVWSLDSLCKQLDQLPVELAKGLHALTVRGLLASTRTSAGLDFKVPNLISKALAPC